jgi:hypothetical protein
MKTRINAVTVGLVAISLGMLSLTVSAGQDEYLRRMTQQFIKEKQDKAAEAARKGTEAPMTLDCPMMDHKKNDSAK